jgi:hypothetical protein
MDVLQLLDAEHVEHEVFVESLALAVPDLSQEVFFEPDLRCVNACRTMTS